LFYNNETLLLEKPRINEYDKPDMPTATIMEHF